jgi:hypothetical protein
MTQMLRSLQIPVALAPAILVDDIRERDTADWPKSTHWIVDRQQGTGVDTGRQAECGLSSLLDSQ